MVRNTRRLLLWTTLAALSAVLLLLALSHLGSWLVVTDPLQKADVIVVFAGELPFREMAAAAIYKEGWAPEVCVTQCIRPVDRELERLGIDYLPQYAYSRRVLQKLGVPAEAIRILEVKTVNTTGEVGAVVGYLRSRSGKRAILVSSKAHTRRIRMTWRALAGRELESVMRYTDMDPELQRARQPSQELCRRSLIQRVADLLARQRQPARVDPLEYVELHLRRCLLLDDEYRHLSSEDSALEAPRKAIVLGTAVLFEELKALKLQRPVGNETFDGREAL
jgi:uncharacterized SAM-binding protein YcdF (DUF218 family)